MLSILKKTSRGVMGEAKTIALPALLFFCLIFPASSHAEQDKIVNSIGMSFALIPPGSFMMGERRGATEASDPDEEPQHRVALSKPFYMGVHEVTQSQWVRVMGYNPSRFRSPDNPVEQVSWNDAIRFIRKLNKLEGGDFYRLPTEAEWEYSARSGSGGFFWFGDDPKMLSQYAWQAENSQKRSHPVGQMPQNPFGLFDLCGNVSEWTMDWYGERYYSKSSYIDPKGPPAGSSKTVRGCSYADPAKYCRSAYRNYLAPKDMNSHIGFRVLRISSRR
jgi:formylglycine-generating enzyme required for sulfatase activity